MNYLPLLLLAQYLLMLLSKLKLKTTPTPTFDEPMKFHLDEEEQQIALEAKKQLEAFSQEIFDEVRQSQILNCTKDSVRGTNLRQSTMTRATENETKSYCKKPSSRTTREKSSCKCQTPSKKGMKCLKMVSPVKESHGNVNSIKFEGDFIADRSEKEKYRINRYFHKIQVSNERKLQKSGLCGVTFRSHTLEPQLNNSLRSHRLFTAKKDLSCYKFEEYLSVGTRRPYSFNETMDGVKKYKNPAIGSPKQGKELKEQNDRPPMGRSGVNLRPQFLRLILKIKQKQQAQCKKKVMIIKGRKSKY